MKAGWQYVASADSVQFLLRCRAAERRRLLDFLWHLADNRNLKPDRIITGESGRQIGVIRFDRFEVSFWIDHFVKELRVVDISAV